VSRGSSPWNGMIIRTDGRAAGERKAERTAEREE